MRRSRIGERRDRPRQVLRKRTRQRPVKQRAQRAVVPDRPIAAAGEALPDLVADLAIVAEDRFGVIDQAMRGRARRQRPAWARKTPPPE